MVVEKQVRKTYQRHGKPNQIFWEADLKAEFIALIKRYDPALKMAPAIVKLIRWAVSENWIPGYIRKEKVMGNDLSRAVEDIGKDRA